MAIDKKTNKFTTSLFDKRDKFGFPIVKFPSISSNIHSSSVYNVYITQIIRYSRVCNDIKYFLISIRSLFRTMLGKGCKKYILLKKLYIILTKRKIIQKYGLKPDVAHNLIK